MKRLLPVLLILSLLLCGCNGAEEAPTTTAVPTTEATVPPTTEATVPPTTEAPTEPPVLYRHPLNGQLLEEPFTGRPVTFTVGNTTAALPQYGISKADVLYEITVEGGLTRCMPIFSDLSDVGPIGSIRSARTYFVSISRAYKSVFVHSGASNYAANLFYQGVVDHVNAEPSIFYRDADRRSAGYAIEHTHFTTGEKALPYLEENFDMTASPEANYGLNFVDEQVLDGDIAEAVQVNFGTGYVKITKFAYDKEAGNYTAFQANRDWIDAETDEVLRFENLLILYAKKQYAPGTTSGNVLHELVGENTGYYISGGKVVPIKWTRAEEDAPFAYFLEDGSPLSLIPGKTYIGVVPPNSPITCE